MLPELDEITITLKDVEEAWGIPVTITNLGEKECYHCLLCRGMIGNGAKVFMLHFVYTKDKATNWDYVHRKCLTVEHVKLKLAK